MAQIMPAGKRKIITKITTMIVFASEKKNPTITKKIFLVGRCGPTEKASASYPYGSRD